MITLNRVITILGLSFLFFLCSCSWFKSNSSIDISKDKLNTPTVVKEKENIQSAAKIIGETASDVGKRSDTIDDHTTQIKIKSTEEQTQKIKTELDGIKTETLGLKEDQAKLISAEEKLKAVEMQLGEQQKAIDQYTEYTKNSEVEKEKLVAKIKELEDSQAKLLKTMMSWISVACVVGIGACLAIGFFLRTPMAFFVAGGCVVTLGVAVAVSLYMQYIAWVVLAILGAGCVGTIIYVATQFHHKDKAVDELVHTGEVAKTYLTSKAREKIFGTKVEPGVAHVIQSAVTRNLVKKARVKAKTHKNFGLASELPQ